MAEAVQFLIRHGYGVIFFWVLAEQLGAPLPAVPLLLAAGALAGTGNLSVSWVLIVALLAALIGDVTWYYIGRRGGTKVLGFLCRMSLEPDSCVRTTEAVYASHGVRSILLAKFVPGLSTVAPPVAGAFKMPLMIFVLWDAAGTLLWAGGFVTLGFIFGRQLEALAATVTQFGTWLFWAVLTSAVLYIAIKYIQRQLLIRRLRVARISCEELAAQLQADPKPWIVDLRHAADFAANPFTLPGALRLSPDELELRHHEIPRDKDVILFCT